MKKRQREAHFKEATRISSKEKMFIDSFQLKVTLEPNNFKQIDSFEISGVQIKCIKI